MILLYCINFMLIKALFKVPNIYFWIGTFPKIHLIWQHDLSLS